MYQLGFLTIFLFCSCTNFHYARTLKDPVYAPDGSYNAVQYIDLKDSSICIFISPGKEESRESAQKLKVKSPDVFTNMILSDKAKYIAVFEGAFQIKDGIAMRLYKKDQLLGEFKHKDLFDENVKYSAQETVGYSVFGFFTELNGENLFCLWHAENESWKIISLKTGMFLKPDKTVLRKVSELGEQTALQIFNDLKSEMHSPAIKYLSLTGREEYRLFFEQRFKEAEYGQFQTMTTFKGQNVGIFNSSSYWASTMDQFLVDWGNEPEYESFRSERLGSVLCVVEKPQLLQKELSGRLFATLIPKDDINKPFQENLFKNQYVRKLDGSDHFIKEGMPLFFEFDSVKNGEYYLRIHWKRRGLFGTPAGVEVKDGDYFYLSETPFTVIPGKEILVESKLEKNK